MLSPILFSVIVFALIFEFINGFHDTANSIATTVYTQALRPGVAIALASSMNFFGALVSEHVAKTFTSGIVSVHLEEYVIVATLLSAITWNLITWWFGLPSSSSHTLIGSLIGAAIVFEWSARHLMWDGILMKIVIPLFTSPMLGFLLAFLLMKLIFWVCRRSTPSKVNFAFRKLQILSAAMVAFSHGTNDAQKTMGIITLAMITANILPVESNVPVWVKLICALTMCMGTAMGGWRIMRTMGRGVTRLEPASGFAAETTAAIVIEAMSFLGAPISTTHTITSSVMGVGSARRLSAVKWSKALDIVTVWVITLPASAFMGGLYCFMIQLIMRLF